MAKPIRRRPPGGNQKKVGKNIPHSRSDRSDVAKYVRSDLRSMGNVSHGLARGAADSRDPSRELRSLSRLRHRRGQLASDHGISFRGLKSRALERGR